MHFKLTEEYKDKVLYELGNIPLPFYNPVDPKVGYSGILDKAKVIVYGYAKGHAVKEMGRRKWHEGNGKTWSVDWSYKPYYTTITTTNPPYTPTITVGNTYPSSTTTTIWANSSVSSDYTVYTCSSNVGGQTAIYDVSSVSNRISDKVKEIINNVKKVNSK